MNYTKESIVKGMQFMYPPTGKIYTIHKTNNEDVIKILWKHSNGGSAKYIINNIVNMFNNGTWVSIDNKPDNQNIDSYEIY